MPDSDQPNVDASNITQHSVNISPEILLYLKLQLTSLMYFQGWYQIIPLYTSSKGDHGNRISVPTYTDVTKNTGSKRHALKKIDKDRTVTFE